MTHMLWLSLCSLLLICLVAKEVRVGLKAGWEAAPLVAETAEYLWEERRHSFWSFLEKLSREAEDSSGVDCWDLLLNVEEERHRMHLAVSLGLHTYAPKTEMRRQRQQKSTACCRVVIQSIGTSASAIDAQRLKADLGSIDVDIIETDDITDFDFEFNFGRSQGKGHSVVVLYAPIGAQCFLSLHQKLKSFVQERDLRYIFRPVFDWSCLESNGHPCARFGTGSLMLGGFGVELALKNTEYIAIDDATQGPSPTTDIPKTEDIMYASLGLQTMQTILRSKQPLATATEILQDFPSHAATLAKIDITEATSSAVKAVSRIVAFDRSFMLLNGMSAPMDDPDFLEFWNRLRNELAASEQLRALKIPDEVMNGLLKLRALDKTEELKDVRFDILPQDLIFLNDVERDPAYRRYYKSLELLLTPYARGGLIPIRKNLLNAVFFVQLGSPVGIETAKLMKELMEEDIPIRLGIVPLLPSWCDRSDVRDQRREEEIVKHFLKLYLIFDAKAALQFWASIEAHQGDIPSLFDTIYASFVNTSRSKRPTSADEDFSKIVSYLERHAEFVRASGICARSTSTLWLNGRLIELEAANVYRMLMYQIRLETRFLQQLVYVGDLTDADKDVIGTIFKKTSTFKKYSPYIEQDDRNVQSILLSDAHFSDAFTIVSNPRGHTHDKTTMHWIVGHGASKEALGIVRSALTFVMSPDGSASQLAFGLTFADACLLQNLWTTIALNRDGQEAKSIAFWIHLLSNDDAIDALLGDQSKRDKLRLLLSDLCKNVDCGVDVAEMTSLQKCSPAKISTDGFVGLDMDVETEMAVISNGRAIFPLRHRSSAVDRPMDGSLTVEDFGILNTIAEEYQMGRNIRLLLNRTLDNVDRLTELTVRAASILRKHHVSPTGKHMFAELNTVPSRF